MVVMHPVSREAVSLIIQSGHPSSLNSIPFHFPLTKLKFSLVPHIRSTSLHSDPTKLNPMASNFRPEIRPYSEANLSQLKIKSPRGALITILEVDISKVSVGELKQLLYRRNRKFTVERQSYTYKPEGTKRYIILKDRLPLSQYNIKNGDTIIFRDLGMHYPWKTEYMFENLLLMAAYFTFYIFHDNYSISPSVKQLQQIALACWFLPHILCIMETLLLPASKRLAPFALTMKVAVPHSILIMIMSYYINGATLLVDESQAHWKSLSVCLWIFLGCSSLRFLIHVCRRNHTPYDFTWYLALLELTALASYFYFFNFVYIGTAFIICTLWKQYILWRIRSDNS